MLLLLSHPSLLFKQFLVGFIVLFSYTCILYFYNIHPLHLLLSPSSHSLISPPKVVPFLQSCHMIVLFSVEILHMRENMNISDLYFRLSSTYGLSRQSRMVWGMSNIHRDGDRELKSKCAAVYLGPLTLACLCILCGPTSHVLLVPLSPEPDQKGKSIVFSKWDGRIPSAGRKQSYQTSGPLIKPQKEIIEF
jgi:hypothetical protein